MGLIYIVVLAAALGAITRYLLPGRSSYGLLLLPAISIVVSSIAWGAFTWAGIDQGTVWMWLVVLGAGALAAIGAALYLPRHRAALEATQLAELTDPRRVA
ncbi:MAG: hypothetical protein KF680_02460 [Cryobacterium sp.]|nr:hypothetical protein [Cryobacterium sp.]